MRVVMIGATGRHAHWVLGELNRRGVQVRALVRNEERGEVALRQGAAETVIADLTRPDTLPDAVAGMDCVFHIGPAHVAKETEMGLAMVAAAEAAGVRKFVYSGVIHPSIADLWNHAAKLPVEEALYSSELTFTVLQPARFMQDFDPFWPDVVSSGRLRQPYSTSSKMCWVDYRDVAEVAAMAIVGGDLDWGTFELCAPGMLDTTEAAAIASDVLGRAISVEQIPLDEYLREFRAGMTEDSMAHMMAHYDRVGLPGGNALVLRAILGREPRSLRDYFGELAAA
ncbi:NmrA family NAD(P)-binding protein [Mycolicibacterium mengxianglii]|uniref:NmrA family NAD(P)-binding protein n=1 Tax=Mycolicibacterium mengxianglii TaxID=2736649 RepID=UPI0018EEEA59|nr:NmrA family NAD(P)-binding protein [Mycolicibacterium mengxianglii]